MGNFHKKEKETFKNLSTKGKIRYLLLGLVFITAIVGIYFGITKVLQKVFNYEIQKSINSLKSQ